MAEKCVGLPYSEEELRELIRKHALLNAYLHGGRALVGPVLGKVLSEKPDLRPFAKKIVPLAQEIVKEVNSLSPAQQKSELEEKWPELLEAKEEKKEKPAGLPPLPNVEKYPKVVVRFAPNPDFALHLGSARPAIVCDEYAKTYRGKYILRFDDTDPKIKKPLPEAYDWIREDLKWLSVEWHEEVRQSARLPIYYEVCERLIEMGKAYVCTCPKEEFRRLVREGKPCPCRSLSPEEHMERWEKMHEEYGEGEAVVRIKTDLSHPNPAVREWPALRIIDTSRNPHPIEGDKYRVWPLFAFACGVDDHYLSISHIIRGYEHVTNEHRQRFMYRYLGWEMPETIYHGRMSIPGAILSKSKMQEGIKQGVYWGIDDPRLATLAALRRRGISPEAIRTLIIQVGIKPSDATVSWENLYAINKSVIDKRAPRAFFVPDPIPLSFRWESPVEAKVPIHPDFPERGERILRIRPENGTCRVFIPREEASRGKVIRLIGALNVKISSVDGEAVGEVVSVSIEDARSHGWPLVQWVPEPLEARVIMPDAAEIKGYCERYCLEMPVGTVLQFQRFGFVRKDSQDPLTFFFAHK